MMLEDLRTYIAASLTTDTVTYGRMPDAPDMAVCIYEYQGSPAFFTHDGMKLLRPNVQVAIRGKDYKVVRQKLEVIEALLEGVHNQVVGSACYTRIFAVQSAFALPGWKDNYVWLAQNYSVEMEA